MKQSAKIRSENRTVVLLRAGMKAVDRIHPGYAAGWAEHFFLTPPRFLPSAEEARVLASGHSFTFRWNGKELAAWSWGDGPTVFFLHGWGGRGGQFHKYFEPLVRAGYSVVTFDAPAHGQSPGKQSSLLEFSDVLSAFVSSMGPAHAVVGHSMGAAAIAMAMHRGLRVPRVVLLACPSDPGQFSRKVTEGLGLSESTRHLMERRLEKRLEFSWSELSVVKAASHFQSKALLIHDADDREVPLREAQRIAAAWPGADLITTKSLGHYRILKDAATVGKALRFLTDSAETHTLHSAV